MQDNGTIEERRGLSATNWRLPRALPTTEQQRHLSSASVETEAHAAIAAKPSPTPEGVQGGVRRCVLQGIWWDWSLDSWMFLGTDLMISILASPHSTEALNPFMVPSDPHD